MARPTGDEDWSTKRIFTTGEAAKVCKVSQQTIIRCFDSGRLNGFRVPGSKFRRIPRDELIRFMRANDIPTEALEVGPVRILVVDDDHRIVSLFEDFLGRDGRFVVRSAQTGYDAGMLTEAFRPNIIVLDYLLPDINGNTVCRRLREHDELSDIRILFISGVIDRDEVEDLIRAGADDFIQKPFDIDDVIRRIEKLVGLPAGDSEGAGAINGNGGENGNGNGDGDGGPS